MTDDTLPLYARCAGVTARDLGDAVFLALHDGGVVFRGNDTVRALWQLLETPLSEAAACEVFCEAFPGTDPEEVEEGVAEALDELFDHGLVLEHHPAGTCQAPA